MHLSVLGGGPVGLEMAVAAVRAGWRVTLIERERELCRNVLSWGHVTLFSPNSLNMSSLGRQLLAEAGAEIPGDEDYLTGREYVEKYLKFLQDFLVNSSHCELLLSSKVVSVGRGHLLKSEQSTASRKRKNYKFRVLIERSLPRNEIEERYVEDIDAVVDATGSYGNHNHVGVGGLPAVGERGLAGDDSLLYTIPDILRHPDKFASGDRDQPRRTMVVGSGASGVTCLSLLERLAREVGGVEVSWVTRRPRDVPPYSVLEGDPLPEREALYRLGNRLAGPHPDTDMDGLRYIPASGLTRLERSEGGKVRVTVKGLETEQEETLSVHTVIAAVGYRPDTSLTQELQIHYCYASEGPMKLAASLVGGGDCLAQQAGGDDTLLSPEPGVFILGMKSYGRSSSFLLRLGHQQVEAVIRILQHQ